MNRLGKICCVTAAGLAVAAAVVPLAIGQTGFGNPRSAFAARVFRVPLSQTTNRIIVKLKPGVDSALAPSPVNPRFMAMTAERAQALSVSAGVPLAPFRVMIGGAHVLSLGRNMSNDEARQVAQRVAADPTVEYAEADTRRFPMQTAVSDPFYASDQWYLWGSGVPVGGVISYGLNVEPAWLNTNTQGQNVVVAVIDTGILPHPDLMQTIAPPTTEVPALNLAPLGPSGTLGYDFITDVATANDGNARDPDPTDPGDWILASESSNSASPFFGCPVADSDWHGTHSAGLIAAREDNTIGIAGVAFKAQIVPLRVLGKCGGFLSDIADAIQWASGAVSSVQPPNTVIPAAQKAQVINLSLGAFGTCGPTEQNAINTALGNGVKAVVVAAGNGDGSDVSQFTPAGCTGVITVAATDRNGSLTNYTNVGTGVSVSAPGGFFTSAADVGNAILSDWEPGADCNGGTTAIPFGSNSNPACSDVGDPHFSFDFAYFYGTSESTALVSGVAALMIAANPAITSTQLKSFLEGSARPFPDCSCTTSTCGAGIVDADFAAQSAQGLTLVQNTAKGATCTPTGQLTGTVFVDANRNGVRDPGEAGLAGATVILTTNNVALIAQTTTDANGVFTFTNVRPLTYDLGALPPANNSDTITGVTVGNLGGTAGPLVDPGTGTTVTGGFTGIVMPAGGSGAGYVMAATPPAPPPSSSGGGGGGGGCTLAGAGSDFDLVFPLCLLAASAGVLGRRRRALRATRSRLDS